MMTKLSPDTWWRALFVGALFVVGLVVVPAVASAQTPTPPKEPGVARASVSSFTLKQLDGTAVKLSELRGKVVVVNFWATWCAPCLQELPFLDALHKKWRERGLVVLAVSVDGPETASDVRRLVKRKRWGLQVLLDPAGKVSAQLNPRGNNPFTLFIDRNGRLAESHEGYKRGDEVRHEATIERLLSEKVQ